MVPSLHGGTTRRATCCERDFGGIGIVGVVAQCLSCVSFNHVTFSGHCCARCESGYFSVAFVTAGMTALVLSFALCIRLLLALLGGRWGWCAVAQTLIRESIRLRISVSFIAIVLIALPLLPIL